MCGSGLVLRKLPIEPFPPLALPYCEITKLEGQVWCDAVMLGLGCGAIRRREFILVMGRAATAPLAAAIGAADLTPDYSSEGGLMLGGNNSAGSWGGSFLW
jgi:hypothetical protein